MHEVKQSDAPKGAVMLPMAVTSPQGIRKEKELKKLTPMKAIRAKCLDCCCGDRKEVRECTITKCALYPYRMGKRPKNDELVDEEDLSAESGSYLNKIDQISDAERK